MMKIVVTGGAGFIGLALARNLVERGPRDAEITLVDNLARHGETAELRALAECSRVRFVQADLSDPEGLDALPSDVDRVFNLAGIVGVSTVIGAPARVLWTNTSIAANVLHWFIRTAAPNARLLYASTSEVYAGNLLGGFVLPIPTPENVPAVIHDPTSPRMSYGMSKLWGEMYGRFVSTETGRFVVSVRYHNVYGPAMGTSHVIPQVIARVLRRETPFRIIGAEETRSFCWIDDAAEATRLVLEAPALQPGQVVHIGDPSGEISIGALYELLFDVLGWRPADVRSGGSSAASVPRRCPDTSLLDSLIGSQPTTPLRVGLERTAKWYTEHHR